MELLNKKVIESYLKNNPRFATTNIHIFDKLSSTNSYLAELIKTNKKNSVVCLAEQQTAGKGRWGKTWFSPFACNIYLSLSWQFYRQLHELSGLNLVVGIAIATALKCYGINSEISFKWPNDILWKKHKLAGILIEFFSETPNFHQAIIGIGLNVNMPEKMGKNIDQPWCDIAQITHTQPARNKLAGLLLDSLLTTLDDFHKRGLKPYLKKWQQLDATYHQKVLVITPQQRISGIGMGVDEKGHFLLKDHNGEIHSFASGEISLRF